MLAWCGGAALGVRQPTDQLPASQTFVLAPRPLRTGTGPLPLTPQCSDTPGWHAHGVSCSNFESWGVCNNSAITQQYRSFKDWSWQFDNPEQNCCACGKLQSSFQRETRAPPVSQQQQLADQQAGMTPPKVIRKLADSTFCWMIYKVGVEDELVEYMHTNRIGAFACDSHAVFSYFDVSDLHEAKCKYGGNNKDGCRVAADGPHALPLLHKGASMDRLDEEAIRAPWEKIRQELERGQIQRQAAETTDTDYSKQKILDEEAKAKKKTRQIAAETERRRAAVDVEQKEMAVKRREAVDAQAKKIADAREAYEAKSLVDDQAEKSLKIAEADARKVAEDIAKIAEENEKQIASVDAEIARISGGTAVADAGGPAKFSTKSQEEAVERETKKVAEERGRKSANADFAAHPGSVPSQETERQLDLVDAVAKKLADAKAEQEAQESAGVPAFNNLGQQPWPAVQTSLAKVAQEVAPTQAHPTDGYRFKQVPTASKLRATRSQGAICAKPATWCVHAGATNEPQHCDDVPGHFCHDIYGESGFKPCDDKIKPTWGQFKCVGADSAESAAARSAAKEAEAAKKLICPEGAYVASGTEATDDWCEDQCAAYGCEPDAQKVCKCSGTHEAQLPKAASEPADDEAKEMTIHHDVNKKPDADDQAMDGWSSDPISSDDQAEKNRKLAEHDAEVVEEANEAQRKAVEAEAKKIASGAAAAAEGSQVDVARTEEEGRDVAKGLAEAAEAAGLANDAERAAMDIAPDPEGSALQATEEAPEYIDEEGTLISPNSICVSLDRDKVTSDWCSTACGSASALEALKQGQDISTVCPPGEPRCRRRLTSPATPHLSPHPFRPSHPYHPAHPFRPSPPFPPCTPLPPPHRPVQVRQGGPADPRLHGGGHGAGAPGGLLQHQALPDGLETALRGGRRLRTRVDHQGRPGHGLLRGPPQGMAPARQRGAAAGGQLRGAHGRRPAATADDARLARDHQRGGGARAEDGHARLREERAAQSGRGALPQRVRRAERVGPLGRRGAHRRRHCHRRRLRQLVQARLHARQRELPPLQEGRRLPSLPRAGQERLACQGQG